MGRTITRAIAILAFSATACATGCAAGIGESRKETAAIAALQDLETAVMNWRSVK